MKPVLLKLLAAAFPLLPALAGAEEDHSHHMPLPAAPAVQMPSSAGAEQDHSLHHAPANSPPRAGVSAPAPLQHSRTQSGPASSADTDRAQHGQAPADAHSAHQHGEAARQPPATLQGSGPVLPAPTPEDLRAAFPELGKHAHMRAPGYGHFVIDRLEAQEVEDTTALAWEAEAGWGNAFDRLVLSSEGERLHGAMAEMRHELFWRHASARWWESRVGIRRDEGEGPGRNWLGIGVEGQAPQFIELSAVAYVGESGRTAFTLEAEYDARITNRLILQPRLELNAFGEDDVQNGIASGLADSEVGLRLRYEFRREVAPYVGKTGKGGAARPALFRDT